MSFLTLLGDALVVKLGFRPKLRGFAPGTQDDDLVTKAQLDAAVPPVPFAADVFVQFDAGGSINGLNNILPLTIELPLAVFSSPISLSGIVFWVDVVRGSYWGDITVTAVVSANMTADVLSPTIGPTNSSSLVLTEINDTPIVGSVFTVDVQISGGGQTLSRTVSLTVIAD